MVEERIVEEDAIVEERAMEARWPGESILGRSIGSLPGLQAPIALSPRATVREAIRRMNGARIGCVMIVAEGRLVGIFTERDVLTRVIGTGIDIEQCTVAELMTTDPECLTLDDEVAYALNKMSVGGFRHVPLIDEAGRPTGLVSMRHIVDYLVDLFPQALLNLPPTPALGMPRQREGA